eukprot:TRINITY_DN1521_c1_g2_i1.p1 TRINITY_DN1521_c1_g2~~TRINITY_DN1521_c1_g2_i1.p1  ORF type:complete len:244 (+),score=18.90 TRINITY_DN1521_c1_g2_i1:76-732(+)
MQSTITALVLFLSMLKVQVSALPVEATDKSNDPEVGEAFMQLSMNTVTGEVCKDVSPPDEFSCERQAELGNCEVMWMVEGDFCAKTCGRCCEDVQPKDGYACSRQKEWGKCDRLWMIDGGFCKNTCGRCPLYQTMAKPQAEYRVQSATAEFTLLDDATLLVPKVEKVAKRETVAAIDNEDYQLDQNEQESDAFELSEEYTENIIIQVLERFLAHVEAN